MINPNCYYSKIFYLQKSKCKLYLFIWGNYETTTVTESIFYEAIIFYILISLICFNVNYIYHFTNVNISFL